MWNPFKHRHAYRLMDVRYGDAKFRTVCGSTLPGVRPMIHFYGCPECGAYRIQCGTAEGIVVEGRMLPGVLFGRPAPDVVDRRLLRLVPTVVLRNEFE